jgi:hypothetical protein
MDILIIIIIAIAVKSIYDKVNGYFLLKIANKAMSKSIERFKDLHPEKWDEIQELRNKRHSHLMMSRHTGQRTIDANGWRDREEDIEISRNMKSSSEQLYEKAMYYNQHILSYILRDIVRNLTEYSKFSDEDVFKKIISIKWNGYSGESITGFAVDDIGFSWYTMDVRFLNVKPRWVS